MDIANFNAEWLYMPSRPQVGFSNLTSGYAWVIMDVPNSDYFWLDLNIRLRGNGQFYYKPFGADVYFENNKIALRQYHGHEYIYRQAISDFYGYHAGFSPEGWPQRSYNLNDGLFAARTNFSVPPRPFSSSQEYRLWKYCRYILGELPSFAWDENGMCAWFSRESNAMLFQESLEMLAQPNPPKQNEYAA